MQAGSTRYVSIGRLQSPSAPLFANELLGGTAEVASATGRRSARSWSGGRKAGILAVHRLRVAIDLTRQRRRVQTRRGEGHGRRGLIGLGEKLGRDRCAAQQHEGRQRKSCHGILRFIFCPRGATAPLWLIALAAISQAPTMPRFPALSRRPLPSGTARLISRGLKRRDRVDNFLCGHNGAGVIRNIDVESRVHLRIRIIGRCVLYHRDLVAELSGKANGRFDAGMGYESNDNELMDAMVLELQVQIRVGEATGTPMLRGDDLSRLRLELATDLATPRAVFEGLMRPRCLLNGRNVLPSLIVARTVSMMQRIEDPKLGLPRGIQDLQHMRNAVIRLCNSPNAVP